MYTQGPMASLDFQEAYLTAAFGFLDVRDVHFVRAENQSRGPEPAAAALISAHASIADVVRGVVHTRGGLSHAAYRHPHLSRRPAGTGRPSGRPQAMAAQAHRHRVVPGGRPMANGLAASCWPTAPIRRHWIASWPKTRSCCISWSMSACAVSSLHCAPRDFWLFETRRGRWNATHGSRRSDAGAVVFRYCRKAYVCIARPQRHLRQTTRRMACS